MPSASQDGPSATFGTKRPQQKSVCPHVTEASAEPESSAKIARMYAIASMYGAKCTGVDGAPLRKKRKTPAPSCGICSASLHRPLVCLTCSFAGCWPRRHMMEHLSQAGHPFAVDVKSGSLFCRSCNDFIYHPIFEEEFRDTLLSVEEKRTPFQENKIERDRFRSWEPDQIEKQQLLDFDVALSRGRRGLLNLGSTCYLSVILQTFIHNPILRNYFLSDKHPLRLCKATKTCVCCEMDKLFADFYSSDISPYGPTSFMHSMWLTSTELAGYAQQDAHEFYLAALHQIHASCRGSTNVSCNCIVHSTFAGSLQSDVTCGECGNVTTTVDPMLDISLDLKGAAASKSKPPLGIPDENTLGACLRRFIRPEKLPHEYQCSECGKSANGAEKRFSFRKLPPVLGFHFKRFEHNSTAQKIDTAIRFPSVLNMAPYTSAAANVETSKFSAFDINQFGPEVLYEYELFAVVNHEGQMNTGHYTNFARSENEWYRFDDDKVMQTTLRACLNSRAYMCFYVKRHLEYRPYQRPSYVIAAEEREREKAATREREKMRQESGGAERQRSLPEVKAEME